MATSHILDPAKSLTFTLLAQSSDGAPSMSMRFPGDHNVPFDPDPNAADGVPQEALDAFNVFRDLMITAAKARLVSQAMSNGDMVVFEDP